MITALIDILLEASSELQSSLPSPAVRVVRGRRAADVLLRERRQYGAGADAGAGLHR